MLRPRLNLLESSIPANRVALPIRVLLVRRTPNTIGRTLGTRVRIENRLQLQEQASTNEEFFERSPRNPTPREVRSRVGLSILCKNQGSPRVLRTGVVHVPFSNEHVGRSLRVSNQGLVRCQFGPSQIQSPDQLNPKGSKVERTKGYQLCIKCCLGLRFAENSLGEFGAPWTNRKRVDPLLESHAMSRWRK